MFSIDGWIVYFKEIGVQTYNYVPQFVKNGGKKSLYNAKVQRLNILYNSRKSKISKSEFLNLFFIFIRSTKAI